MNETFTHLTDRDFLRLSGLGIISIISIACLGPFGIGQGVGFEDETDPSYPNPSRSTDVDPTGLNQTEPQSPQGQNYPWDAERDPVEADYIRQQLIRESNTPENQESILRRLPPDLDSIISRITVNPNTKPGTGSGIIMNHKEVVITGQNTDQKWRLFNLLTAIHVLEDTFGKNIEKGNNLTTSSLYEQNNNLPEMVAKPLFFKNIGNGMGSLIYAIESENIAGKKWPVKGLDILGNGNSLTIGDELIIAGTSRGGDGNIILAEGKRAPNYKYNYFIDAVIHIGVSGGPVFNPPSGKLIGIVYGINEKIVNKALVLTVDQNLAKFFEDDYWVPQARKLLEEQIA